MRKLEPVLTLPLMSEDAYRQEILDFLSQNPQDNGCVQVTFTDQSGAHSEREFLRSWATPQTAYAAARTLAEHIRRKRQSWQSVILTIRDLPSP
jgi:hypothetical protein